jgi:methyl-accepting chemotaxis protein
MPSVFTRTIGRKLSASFGVLLLFLLIVGGTGAAGILNIQNNLHSVMDINLKMQQDSLNAWVELLQAQHSAENYMLYHAEFGLEEARAQVVEPFVQNMNDLRHRLNALIVLDTEKGHLDDVEIEQNMLALTDSYQATFLMIVDLHEQRGVVDEGIIGDFRSAAHELEARFAEDSDPRFQVLLLQMRRSEKDYMLRGDMQYVENVRSLAAQLKASIATADWGATRMTETSTIIDRYLQGFESLVAVDAQIAEQTAAYRQVAQTIADPLDHIAVEGEAGTTEAQEVIYATLSSALVIVVITMIAAILIGFALAAVITRLITTPLAQITRAAESVAAGDLDQHVVVNSRDETGRLAEAFNIMLESLKRTMGSQVAKEYLEGVINQYRSFVAQVSEGNLTTRLQLNATNDDLFQLGLNLNAMVEGLSAMANQSREVASSLSSAAAEILAATTQQIASATEQEAAVTQTIATVEEVRVTVKQTSDRAQSVAAASHQSLEVSRGGQESVSNSIDGMKLLQERVESIAENILLLSERTQQIGEIIQTVDEIADQSKLLALNASIEAARAGEEGRGFAVVAMEVRQLAEQSRTATARVRDILNQIQQATNSAVMVTEEGSKGAETGMVLVERAGVSIRDLATTIEEAAQAASQIAASTYQQSNGMDQLVAAIAAISQATSQTAASTRQAELSAQELNDMAHEMQQAVARYRL